LDIFWFFVNSSEAAGEELGVSPTPWSWFTLEETSPVGTTAKESTAGKLRFGVWEESGLGLAVFDFLFLGTRVGFAFSA
jgi:hypothetical protein